MSVIDVVGVQTPRVRSVPPRFESRGREAIEVAESVGLHLDPFQELALEDACGVREDGKWAAFEIGVDLARQNGKGGILEARELAGILAWGERLLIHSAHEFQTATEAMLRMEELLAGTPEVSVQVKSVSRSHGSEGFIFKSGQRLRYRTRTKGGGRGFTGDTVIFDEAMELRESFIGALLPTMSARSIHGNPQVWYTGSAVDQTVHEHGVVFARLRARGLRGDDPSLVWLEWSACDPLDEEGRPITPERLEAAMLGDLEAWRSANPALGIRISPEHVEKELRSMDARTFAVERLGIGDWPDVTGENGAVIALSAWDELVDEASAITGAVSFTFDVEPDRKWSSIAKGGLRDDGQVHVELVERREGTSWLADRLKDLDDEFAPASIACAGASPAASMVREIAALGVEVEELDETDHAKACGKLVDLVREKGLRHLGHPELRTALKGARKRTLGESWAWSRRNSKIDISPLVAVTLAAWLAGERVYEPWAASW